MIDHKKLFVEIGLDIKYKNEDRLLWSHTYERLHYRSTRYLSSSMDYQMAYHEGSGGEWAEISVVIHSDQKPVALWPLTLSKRDGNVAMTSQGLPLLPPVFIADCPDKTRKRVTTNCLQLAAQFAEKLGLTSWVSAPAFDSERDLGYWHAMAMANGASCSTHHDLFVDLRQSLAEIKSQFRRSYRSLVTSGQRLWNVEILSTPGDVTIWDEFHSLHHEVAGRVTRTLETWELQYAALIGGEGFLVSLRNEERRMVGAGYFTFSADEGVYSVGAYDRNLFDKPLGHVVQYHAIEELRRRGCRWYHIGARVFPGNEPSPSAKELSIAHFKQGFSTHLFPSFRLTHSV